MDIGEKLVTHKTPLLLLLLEQVASNFHRTKNYKGLRETTKMKIGLLCSHAIHIQVTTPVIICYALIYQQLTDLTMELHVSIFCLQGQKNESKT